MTDKDTIVTLRRAIRQILDIHRPGAVGHCSHCEWPMPCPTVAALAGTGMLSAKGARS